MAFAHPPAPAVAPDSLTRAMNAHWRVFVFEGAVLIVLGVAAIIVPPLAGLDTAVLLGWVFLMAGVVGLISTFKVRGAPGFKWSLLSALVAMAAGALLLWNPLPRPHALTDVLTAFFILDGLVIIFLGFSRRQKLAGRWEWLMVNGVIDLVFAGIVIAGLPGAVVWVLGLLVGIDLSFGGASLIALAMSSRNAAGSPPAAS